MRMLLIDDDEYVVESISNALAGDLEIYVASSRESAIAVLGQDHGFDLVVCDLKIPDGARDLSLSDAHGIAVHEAFRAALPGVPQILFTGFATTRNVRGPLSRGRVSDIFGDGLLVNMVELFHKDEMLQCVEYIKDLARRSDELDSSVRVTSGLDLRTEDVRSLRIYARRIEAVDVEVTPMGGLSGARTMCAVFTDRNGSIRARTFVKMNSREVVSAEHDRYRKYVPNLLLDSFPAEARIIFDGLRGSGAAFFSLAPSGSYRSLFRVLQDDEATARRALATLRLKLSPWSDSRSSRDISLGELRRNRIADERFPAWRSFASLESKEIALVESVQHGDLHGENVLVNVDGDPLFIDYGDVDRAPAALDPVTLELSLIFHSDSPFRPLGWPSVDSIEHWPDLDRYLVGCPIPEFVRSVREWSLDSADDTQIAALVYAHAARQLKYADTDHERATYYMKAAMVLLN